MKRAVLIFSFLFLTTVYTEPLILAKDKRVYYCSQCGTELLSSLAVSQMLVGINPESLLCDACRKEQSKGREGKSTGQAILKYTGGQGEAYFSGHPTQAQLDASLVNHKTMQEYLKQNFIYAAAGGFHLRLNRGESTLFMTDPYSAEPYSIMAPVKSVSFVEEGKERRKRTVHHKIVAAIPFKDVFLLFPDQQDTHDVYQFDPTKNKEQRFTLLKERKLIELLSGIPQPAKEPESAQQKQPQYVEENF